MNCRGLSDKYKRRDIFKYMREKKASIICLQGIHLDPNLEIYVQKEWGLDAILCPYKSNARGVAILFNNNFEFKVNRYKKDLNGNYIVVDLLIEQKQITLVNVYGPNKDSPQFYTGLLEIIKEFPNNHVLACGDWNIALDPDLDTINYIHDNNPNARAVVKDIMYDLNLIDVWRHTYPESKDYTWRQPNSRKQSRIDYFLISETLASCLEKVDIKCGYRTDHNSITLELRFNDNIPGRGYWKFNSSLLRDKDYVDQIKSSINDTVECYAVPVYERSKLFEINPQDLQLTIGDGLFLEVLLMNIRGTTISYGSWKKKKLKEEESTLENKINDLDVRIRESPNTVPETVLEEFSTLKKQLEEIRTDKIKGTILRSRARWIDEGEKPTKYFLNLENRNFTSKLIPKLILEDGSEITDTAEILKAQKTYYKELYSEQNVDDDLTDNVLENLDSPKLSEKSSESLEGLITYEELTSTLKTFKNGKSPGLDGYTAEFFKFFWKDVGVYVLRAINDAYQEGKMSITQRRGLITCLPKPGKSKFLVKNWRPISLLNVIYKLSSACIASRIKRTLGSLINEDQKGFIAERFIGENTRLIYDILFETKKQNIPGLLLLVDFEKAFDSLSWKFLNKVLRFFNFGPSIQRWINVFYTDIESCIIQNGHISSCFGVERGCRQGDPLSPYLFILCVEILGHMIRQNKDIVGIKIHKIEHVISQYADDTQLFLNASERSLKTALQMLTLFHKISGLKINVEKTKVAWIGSKTGCKTKLCRETNLDWDADNFIILGINFSTDVNELWNLNFPKKFEAINHLLLNWKKRKLTLMGKICVIKSLALSKLTHLIFTLHSPPKKMIKKLNAILFKFLWNGPDKVKRRIITKSYKEGGLRMIDIDSFIKALRVSWLRRVIRGERKWQECFLKIIDENNYFWKVGALYMKSKINKVENKFWKEVIVSWAQFQNTHTATTFEEITSEPLWFNRHFSKPYLFFSDWARHNVLTIKDILGVDGKVLNFTDFKNKFAVSGTILDYNRLLHNIPRLWRETFKSESHDINPYDSNLNMSLKCLMKQSKGCRNIYEQFKTFGETGELETIAHSRWLKQLNLDMINWKTVYTQIYQCTNDTKLQDFQYKLIHRILVTNVSLVKFGIKDSDKCSFCGKEKETILHLFVECDKVRPLWSSIQDWLNSKLNLRIPILFSNTDLILGSQRPNFILINFILLLTKQYIYRCKFLKEDISSEALKAIIKYRFHLERQIAIRSKNMQPFFQKWAQLYTILSDNE